MPAANLSRGKRLTELVTSGDGALGTTGYVSLRVRATDRDGGAIEQTVMRASGLK